MGINHKGVGCRFLEISGHLVPVFLGATANDGLFSPAQLLQMGIRWGVWGPSFAGLRVLPRAIEL